MAGGPIPKPVRIFAPITIIMFQQELNGEVELLSRCRLVLEKADNGLSDIRIIGNPQIHWRPISLSLAAVAPPASVLFSDTFVVYVILGRCFSV